MAGQSRIQTMLPRTVRFLLGCMTILAFPWLPSGPVVPSAAESDRTEPVLEEAVDFFQYTDNEGGIHFVDSPDKIPRKYRGRAIARKETLSARQTTRVRVVDRQVYVPVTLRNGDRTASATFLFDTGSSVTILTTEFARRLGIGPDSGQPATVRLADGHEVAVRLVRVDAVMVGFRSRSPLQVGIMQHVGSREMHDGLLGLDFLGEFQYQLDMANELIRWQ